MSQRTALFRYILGIAGTSIVIAVGITLFGLAFVFAPGNRLVNNTLAEWGSLLLGFGWMPFIPLWQAKSYLPR